jgi:hypothetical protein
LVQLKNKQILFNLLFYLHGLNKSKNFIMISSVEFRKVEIVCEKQQFFIFLPAFFICFHYFLFDIWENYLSSVSFFFFEHFAIFRILQY